MKRLLAAWFALNRRSLSRIFWLPPKFHSATRFRYSLPDGSFYLPDFTIE